MKKVKYSPKEILINLIVLIVTIGLMIYFIYAVREVLKQWNNTMITIGEGL